MKSKFNSAEFNTFYATFKKSKSAVEIVQQLSRGDFWVAMKPGTLGDESETVIEFMVSKDAKSGAVRDCLKAGFPDFENVTNSFSSFLIGVSANQITLATTALGSFAFRVNPVHRIFDGVAFIEVVAGAQATTEDFVSCLNDAEVETSCVEADTHSTPDANRFPGWNNANLGQWSGWNNAAGSPTWKPPSSGPAFDNAGWRSALNDGAWTGAWDELDHAFLADHVFPMIWKDLSSGGPLAQASISRGINPARFWSSVMNTVACVGWFGPTNARNTTFDKASASPIISELMNPASPICDALHHMGCDPAWVASFFSPFFAGASKESDELENTAGSHDGNGAVAACNTVPSGALA